MPRLPEIFGPYSDAPTFTSRWRELCEHLRGHEIQVGNSVEGRPLWRFDFGPSDAPTVLLSGLIHGNEFIGSVSLFHVVEKLLTSERGVAEKLRLVVLPTLNPDAFAENAERLARGHLAFRRSNAHGVDLNRNFPWLADRLPRHPLAGSRYSWAPYYVGPHPFSEPETQAVRDVVAQTRPSLSLAFHSFGEQLLYPWAFSGQPNPREGIYRMLGRAFVKGLAQRGYQVRQAHSLYSTVGDMDDWLDGRHQVLAHTIEVGFLDRRLLHPRRFRNPFCWMNPVRVEETVKNLVPGVLALLRLAADWLANAIRLPFLRPAN